MTADSVTDFSTLENLCWADTASEVRSVSFVWKVRNFSSCILKPSTAITSPTFSDSPSNDPKWRLQLRVYLGPCGLYLNPGLELVSSSKRTIEVAFCISLLDSQKNRVYTQEVGQYKNLSPENCAIFDVNHVHEVSDFILKDVLFKKSSMFLPGDTLTLICELSIFGDIIVLAEQCHPKLFEIPSGTLSRDMKNLFDSQRFWDVILRADGKELKAHKSILSSRSPVFSAMFNHDTKEQQENVVDVEGIEFDTLQQLVRFIYTDEIQDVKELADKLLIAADRYGLDRLKAKCEKVLYQGISTDNAMELLIFADRHSAEQLKIRTIKFITRFVEDVKESVEWKKIRVQNT